MKSAGYRNGAMLLAFAGIAVACSDSSRPAVTGNDGDRVSLALASTTGSALLLDPRTASLEVGFGLMVSVNITGADGQRVAGARPTWRSTNESVVRVTVVPDSGVATDGMRAAVAAVGVGTAKVIASYDGVADTATITVSPSTAVRPPAILRQYDMGIYVSTTFDSTALAIWRREAVPGATVRLVQLPLLAGDTVPADFPRVTQPTLYTTAVTNADGYVEFKDVPMSRYRIEVQPPTPWKAWSQEFGPPYYLGSVRFEIRLAKD